MRGRSLCINEDGKPPPFFFSMSAGICSGAVWSHRLLNMKGLQWGEKKLKK